MRFPSSPRCPYVRHSTSGITVVAENNGRQKTTYCPLMQTSAHEIKDKLLRALDQEYNVVDMATVLEVISLLEKAIITRETLEKTRIGKYINELRKRTNNEHLSRRAKNLVKSWRQLLPQSSSSVNGERVPTSPGPECVPGSAGKMSKSIVPGSPHCKTPSPSILYERSASPSCSSASNSPKSIIKLQGSNRPLTPIYTPTIKFNQTSLHNDKVQNKTLISSNSQNKNHALSSQIFKPVSPAMQLFDSNSCTGSANCFTDSLHVPKPQSPYTSPAHVNSTRSFRLTSAVQFAEADSTDEQSEKCENVTSPSISTCPVVVSGNVHSSVEIAKTNVANKRLRKVHQGISSTKKLKSTLNYSSSNDIHLVNGSDSQLESSLEILQHSPSSSLKSIKSESEYEKKRALESHLPSDFLKDRFSTINPGGKLPKVKTTQQLIEEFQAKKDSLSLPYPKMRDHSGTETDSFPWKRSPNHSVPASELLRSKSELMKKFLSSSPESPSATSDHDSPIADRLTSSFSDIVPSKISVITSVKDTSVPFTDPVDAEIDQILSQLPPINIDEINFEEDSLPERSTTVTSDDLDRFYSQHCEGVSGNYDADGVWRSWLEPVDKYVAPGDMLRILPYVNID